MYPDAFTIERLAIECDGLLKGTHLKDIFSSSKTDLFFVFSDKKGFKIQLFWGQMFFQFIPIEQFPTKNRQTWFKAIHNQPVIESKSHMHSRSFDLQFPGGYKLVFKIFGKFSNVILFDDSNTAVEIFSLNYPKDLQTPYTAYVKEESLIHSTESLESFSKLYPWFGNDSLTFLEQLGYFKASPADRANLFMVLKEHYLFKDVNIVKKGENSFTLSSFPNPDSIGKYSGIHKAFNDFSRLFIGAESFKLKKTSQLANLEKKIAIKQKLQNDLTASLATIKQKRSYSQLGDLIMANLHSIHTGISKVEVFDFYNESKLFIKLKTDLNPQQNAALFYQKAKNEVKESEFKQRSLDAVHIELEFLIGQLEKLKEADDPKKLRMMDKSLPHPEKEKQSTLPYRLYKIGGFDVYVGKNSKANDDLLSKHSSKNDTWLHAKDVSGSHVIIKNPGLKPIPGPVLEEIAALAAWYSKSKTNSLAPVIYTLRKFVRKIKGATAGKVIVEKEKVILVEPKDVQ